MRLQALFNLRKHEYRRFVNFSPNTDAVCRGRNVAQSWGSPSREMTAMKPREVVGDTSQPYLFTYAYFYSYVSSRAQAFWVVRLD